MQLGPHISLSYFPLALCLSAYLILFLFVLVIYRVTLKVTIKSRENFHTLQTVSGKVLEENLHSAIKENKGLFHAFLQCFCQRFSFQSEKFLWPESSAIKFEIRNGGNFVEASILYNCSIQSCGTLLNEL